MPDQAGAAALSEQNLIDGVTNSVDQQQDILNGITQTLRSFCDNILGPAPSQPPSQPPGAGLTGPDTRGSKLVKSTERLSIGVRELNDQVLRLRRI